MLKFLVLAALLAVAGAKSFKPLKTDTVEPPYKNSLQRDNSAYRLSGTVIPSHYEIKITPQFKDDNADSFTGSVKIKAAIAVNTTSITLHCSNNIKTEDVVVCHESNEKNCKDNTLIQKQPTTNALYEFLELQLKGTLKEGEKIIIIINYNADFPDGMYGFYKSAYSLTAQNGAKEDHILYTTQFQPTHARKAFPCFDEPEFKATFDVTLVVPKGYNAISNAPASSTKTQTRDGSTESTEIAFNTTPKMSTYLLAFIVYKEGAFISTDPVGKSPTFRTWARASEIASGSGQLCQTEAPKIIEEMQKFTNIPYSNQSSKIDQAAIPDFSFGAMENWGLVTYRETALLFDAKDHTQLAKRRVAEVIAHELSHQWFGNLVTTEWWGTAWLNEGFATYFEYYIMHALHPQWRMWERMVVDEQLAALEADATESASPMSALVNSPEEVTAHFGTITYSKGGSVLRMFENMIGEANFKSALRSYLLENQLGSVTPNILFNELKKNVGQLGLPDGVDLGSIFESWTNTSGFPVVKVNRTETEINLSQEQFLADGASAPNIYNVLLTLTSNDESFNDINVWLLESEATVSTAPSSGSWLLVPTNGYYRVNYDDENWALLVQQMHIQNQNSISPLERAILIDNALNLARANKLKYSLAIQVLSYLQNEVDYIPWNVAFSGLNYIHRILSGDGDTVNKFLLHIINTVYNELGFVVEESKEDEKHIEHVHRANVLNWACRAGHPECLQSAVEHLQNYLEKEEIVEVAPDLRSVVYCYGVKHRDNLWPKLWKKLEETDDASERALLITALGCSDDPNTLYMYLQTAVLSDMIRTQDIASVFTAVNSNPKGINVTLEFLNFNLPKIEERVSTVLNGLSKIIRGTAQYINKENQLRKLEEIAPRLTGNVNQEVAKVAIETATINLEWLQHNGKDVLSEMEQVLEGGGGGIVPTAPSTTTQGAGALRPPLFALAVAILFPCIAFLL